MGDNGDNGGNNANGDDEQQQQILRMQEKQEEILHLQERVRSLSSQLAVALQKQAAAGSTTGGKRRHQPLLPHATNVREVPHPGQRAPHHGGYNKHGNDGGGGGGHGGSGRTVIHAAKERIGRSASICTRSVLDHALLTAEHEEASRNVPAVQRVLEMFQHPASYVDYLNSDQFAKDVFKLASRTRHLLDQEPRVVFVQSPCYVFGDIHGNLEDLHFFSDNLWRLGMNLTAGNFLFLGDYVDRGLNCLECVAYLLAMKIQLPTKVYLLRGNHETRDVNGWEEHYAERAFIYQCRARFGDEIGYRLWESCNQVFDRLPLAAVIDQDIFCVHGGIPRPVRHFQQEHQEGVLEDNGGGANANNNHTTRIQDILTVPRVAGINPPYEHEDDCYQQVASDCIWSDPASEQQEMNAVDPETGYGQSLRGGGAICFGAKAVTQFLQEQDFSYIMRAHEAHAEGVAVSKGARVFTVFSTSKDHNQGKAAMAGCILVDNDKLQVINRSPAYRNQYVHRRDSMSVAALPEHEIQKRMRLGLVTAHGGDGHSQSTEDEDEDDEELDQWDDFLDSSEDEGGHHHQGGGGAGGGGAGDAADQQQAHNNKGMHRREEKFHFAQGRRSSVDMTSMMTNMHDSTAEIELPASAIGGGASIYASSDTIAVEEEPTEDDPEAMREA